MTVGVGVIAECVGVLWHWWTYSNLFLSLIIVWSNVKPKLLFSLPVFSFFPPLQHQLSALAPGRHSMASASELLADIMTTRGQPAPQYHVLSQRHCGISCLVMPCLNKALNVSFSLASVSGCQSNLTQEEQPRLVGIKNSF